jgi:hypothetical protein
MKRICARQNRSLLTGSDCSENNVIGSSSDCDERWGATYETDVTEPDVTGPDDRPSPRKRLRSNQKDPALEPSLSSEADKFYDNPLNDSGIELCEIDEDFDKAEGTIEQQERIETRWKQSVTQAKCRLCCSLLMQA